MTIESMGEIIFLVMKLIWHISLALSLPLFCIIWIRFFLEVRRSSPRIASPSQMKWYYLLNNINMYPEDPFETSLGLKNSSSSHRIRNYEDPYEILPADEDPF